MKRRLTPILCVHGQATSWQGTSRLGDLLPEVEHCAACNPTARVLRFGDLVAGTDMPDHAREELEVDRLNEERREARYGRGDWLPRGET